VRKLALLIAVPVAALAVAAGAVAQTTGYDLTASTAPAKAGSKKKPVPIQLKFGLEANAGANRPTTVQNFQVAFEGLRSNGKLFPKCTADAINDAQGDEGCPKGAVVGSGTVNNFAGAASNLADRSIQCDLKLTMYNSGNKRLALFLEGAPSGNLPHCAIPISQAIDARMVKAGGGEALRFVIPSNLMHPVAGIDNGILRIQTTIKKRTVKKGGKRVGFFEAVGCKGGSRDVALTVSGEAGETLSAKTTTKC
jgi:hypothetical protein